MAKTKVAFAVACNKWQTREWWLAFQSAIVAAERDPEIDFVDVYVNNSASPDFNKNGIVAEAVESRRPELTDASRNAIMSNVEQDSKADYIYWWDDDTVHPPGTLRKLLDLHVPFAAGVYFTKQIPYVPIAYFINPNGTYRSMLNYRRGELVEVDFTGMGCALIHRDVYRDIRVAHSVFKNSRGGYFVVENSKVHSEKAKLGEVGHVYGDLMVEQAIPVPEKEAAASRLHFPFYGMEVTRTEDIWFCQLAANVGVKPLIDTDVNCGHLGEFPITRANFKRYSFTPKEASDEPESQQAK